MAVTDEDLGEVVTLLWNGSATITALVTGGLILGRVPDGQQIAAPYCSYEIKSGDQVKNAGPAYLQPFTVQFRTFDETGAADLGPVMLAIENTFGPANGSGGGLAPGAQFTVPSGRTVRVLGSQKKAGTLGEDPATQKGRAVKFAQNVFELLCQG